MYASWSSHLPKTVSWEGNKAQPLTDQNVNNALFSAIIAMWALEMSDDL